MKGVGASLLIGLILPVAGAAQNAADATAGIAAQRKSPSTAAVTIASAILPGAGQAMMRQKRSAVYIALEAAGSRFLKV